MTVDLYYILASGPCRAVLLAASSLGVELNLKYTDLPKGEQLTPEFLKMSPQHKVPVLDDNGFVISESRAIIAYLADQYGKDDTLYPKDPKKRAVVNQRCYFDMGTLYQRFGDLYFPVFYFNGSYDEEKATKLREALEILDKFLANSTYAAGDSMTIADCTLVATVSTIEAFDFDISKYTNVTKWLQKCKENIKNYDTFNQAGLDAYKAYIASIKGKKSFYMLQSNLYQ